LFSPLPADTVFEAKQRSTRNTVLLFIFLGITYGVVFGLMGLALSFSSDKFLSFSVWPPLQGMVVGFVIAGLHFLWARSKDITYLTRQFNAGPASEQDTFHKQFSNTVEEAKIALGLKAVEAVVVPSHAMNAFSFEDWKGRQVIGITEGLLSRLTRAELEAVVAHEAAHLAHGDSRVITTACTLFSVLFFISEILRPRGRSSSKGGGAIVAVWLLSLVGALVSRLTFMAISRNREYYADSDAVHMCKNPLALANALNKIATADRGALVVPEGLSPAFIMNPQYASTDEKEGFFSNLLSTHPPVQKRISKLQVWAKGAIEAMPSPSHPAPDKPLVLNAQSSWEGPVDPKVSVAQAVMTPDSWIWDGRDLKRAVESPICYKEFVDKLNHKNSKYACPRCEVPLEDSDYEGMPAMVCRYCAGKLIYRNGIEKAVNRRLEKFGAEDAVRTKEWRKLQRGTVGELCRLPFINCPICGKTMFKSFYSELTRVIIDLCTDEKCGAVWCDPQELERIQILIESASERQ
jgi:heat shock protein HtpX